MTMVIYETGKLTKILTAYKENDIIFEKSGKQQDIKMHAKINGDLCVSLNQV